MLIGLYNYHDIFEAFDQSFNRTDFRDAGIEFLRIWRDWDHFSGHK